MKNKAFNWSLTVALAGFLFGFDTVVISGANLPIKALWNTTPFFHGTFIMSMALWGTVVGSLLGGIPCERFGRKRTLFWIGVLYLVSALGSALALDPYTFSVFRFIGGLGVGASSVAAPTYISEISSAENRGRFVALYQFNIVFGIFVAFISNYLIGLSGGENAWRWMLGVEAIPAVIYCMLVLGVSNSPRWLVLKRKEDEKALGILTQVAQGDQPEAQRMLAAIKSSEGTSAQPREKIFSTRYRTPLTLAFLLAFFNQLSGINFVLYYAPELLEKAGLAAQDSLGNSIAIGGVNLIFTLLGMYLIDRVGRKTLMYWGSFGYIIGLSMVAYAFYAGASSIFLLSFILLFIAAHAIGQGAVIWVFISEIFPNKVRAFGQSFGSGTHWVFAALITLLTPVFIDADSGIFSDNPWPVFAFFAAFMVLQLGFVHFMMPETKGVSLEELQRKLVGKVNLFPWLFALGFLSLGGCGTPDLANEKTVAYQEQHRPQFHFTPDSMWMNDPNGMVYYAGEYHLFYQYYPDSNVWGPMHWGHAISADLINWEHLPIALYPDSLGYIFSGSAVVDWNNTSGFSQGDEPPLIAIFTHHDPVGAAAERNDFQYQSIAYSTDKGRSWTKYAGNPVIDNPGIRDFRDPKVVWDASSGQWLMVFAAYDHVKLYGSPNLIDWRHLSDFGREWGSHAGIWECPDLFPITATGTKEKKWVLLSSINPGSPNGGSGTQYFVGDFDGQQFTLDSAFAAYLEPATEKAVWLEYGRDNYAGVTWSDIPATDGRRIFLGWMSNWDYAMQVPTERWRSAMTLPRVLELVATAAGPRLRQSFPAELTQLREEAEISTHSLAPDEPVTLAASPQALELILTVSELPAAKTGQFGVRLSNTLGETYTLGFDFAEQAYFSDRRKSGKTGFADKFSGSVHRAPYRGEGTSLQLHLILDVSSAELLADDGRVGMTELFFPNEDFTQLDLFTTGITLEQVRVKQYSLKTIW